MCCAQFSGASVDSPQLNAEQSLKTAFSTLDSNPQEAAATFKTLLENPEFEEFWPAALAGLVRVSVKEGELETARTLMTKIETDHSSSLKDERVKAAANALNLAEESGASGSVTELEAAVAANPDDLSARYNYAVKLLVDNRHEDALNAAIEIVKRDRTWEEGKASQFLVKMFEMLGSSHPVTKKGRSRLANFMHV